MELVRFFSVFFAHKITNLAPSVRIIFMTNGTKCQAREKKFIGFRRAMLAKVVWEFIRMNECMHQWVQLSVVPYRISRNAISQPS